LLGAPHEDENLAYKGQTFKGIRPPCFWLGKGMFVFPWLAQIQRLLVEQAEQNASQYFEHLTRDIRIETSGRRNKWE